MNSIANTPDLRHLFNIKSDVKKLPEGKAQLFHHLVAKLPYLCRFTRQNIQKIMVEFLCTWVKELDKDNHKRTGKGNAIYQG